MDVQGAHYQNQILPYFIVYQFFMSDFEHYHYQVSLLSIFELIVLHNPACLQAVS